MAIRQKTVVPLKANGHCPSHSLSQVTVRDVTFSIDEPAERGGTNQGPTPTETAVSALIGCTNVIGNKCAEKLGINIGHLEISATAMFDRRGVMLSEEIDVPFERIELSVVADGPASHEQLQQVAAEVAKYCPLSKLFKAAGTVIEETWRPKGD